MLPNTAMRSRSLASYARAVRAERRINRPLTPVVARPMKSRRLSSRCVLFMRVRSDAPALPVFILEKFRRARMVRDQSAHGFKLQRLAGKPCGKAAHIEKPGKWRRVFKVG